MKSPNLSTHFADKIRTNWTHNGSHYTQCATFEKTSPKKLKQRVFRAHPLESWFGGIYIQKHLAKFSPVIPTVYYVDQNPAYYISEFIPGVTADEITEISDLTIQKQVAQELGRILAEVHNITANSHFSSILSPLKYGEVGYSHTNNRLKITRFESNSSIKSIEKLADYRYNSTSDFNNNQLYSFIKEIFSTSSLEKFTPVISNFDYRTPNVSFQFHSSGIATSSVFDWDRVLYGDWLFGLAIGEFFLLNFTENRDEWIPLVNEYRKSYMKNRDWSTIPNRQRKIYRAYIGVMFLQQIRSIKYWVDQSSIKSALEKTQQKCDKLINNSFVISSELFERSSD